MKEIKIKIFIFLLCFYYSKEFKHNDHKLNTFLNNNFINNSLFKSFISKSNDEPSTDDIKKLLVKFIDFIIYTSATNDTITISDNCKNNYTMAFNYETIESTYFNILYDKSSKSKNDLGSYQDCLNYYNESNSSETNTIEIKKNNLTYLIIHIREEITNIFGDPEKEEGEYLIGLCVPNACKENEYKKIFRIVNEQISIFNNAK